MNLETANIPQFEPKKLSLPDAPFLSYSPDMEVVKRAWQEFGAFKNILVIAHGGSVTSFYGMYQALGTNKKVVTLSTTDPEYVSQLKKELPKHETLVLTISKSGENITQLEATMQFLDYPLLFIAGKGSTLEQIGKKTGARIIEHPPIGGRYTAFTEVALIPAAICGLDAEGLLSGGKDMHAQYARDNLALKAAQIFYKLEQDGYVDVFMPFYSHYLFPFSNLIVQLCHESFGKEGKGQSFIAAESPESQHHTNQRFFGGRKNIAGFFTRLENFRTDLTTAIPAGMQSIPIKDGSLENLDKIPLSYSMHSEFQGTFEDAKLNNIPAAVLNVREISAKEIGSYIAFWQMFAVYSSVLRDVNPFDQPEVENSKAISWRNRKNFKS